VQCCIFIGQVDGLQVSSAYINTADDALLRMKSLRSGSYISNVHFASTYFDALTTLTDNHVHVPDDGFPASFITSVSFSGCTFGNCNTSAFLIRKYVDSFGVDGGMIENTRQWAVDYEVPATNGDLTFSGVRLKNIGTAAGATGSFRIIGAAEVSIDCTLNNSPGTAAVFRLGGTINRASIRGSYSGFSGPLLDRTGATLGSFFFEPSAATQTWTPNPTFLGASVGMSETASGQYTLSNGWCTGTGIATLSAKGSSVGNLYLEGLPFPPREDTVCSVRLDGMASSVGDSALTAMVQPATNAVRFYRMSSGSAVSLTDADCTDTTSIRVSFSYQI
jgi:hypothetical protein